MSLLLLGIFLINVFLVGLLDDSNSFIHKLTIGFTHTLLLFCVIMQFLFYFDKFSFLSTLIIEFIILSLVVIFYRKKISVINFKLCDFKDEVLLIIILLLLALGSSRKAELYHMGQDEGVYQGEAIAMAYGETSQQPEFEEYLEIDNEADRETYYRMVDNGIVGFYPRNIRNEFYMQHKGSLAAGTYHGIHAFSSVLALFSIIFGIKNMLYVQTLILLCSASLIFFSLKNRGHSSFRSFIFMLLFGISPIVIWVSKNSYSEMLVLLSICLFLYYYSNEQDNNKYGLSLSLIYFSFTHIIFLIFYPIFWLLFVIRIINTKKINHVFSCLITGGSLIVSTILFAGTCNSYLFDNYNRLYYEPILNMYNIITWIIVGTIISVLLCFIIYAVVNKKNMKIEKANNYYKLLSKTLIVLMLCYTVYKVFTIANYSGSMDDLFSAEKAYYGRGLIQALFHISYTGIFLYSGGLIVIIIILTYLKKKEFWKNYNNITDLVLFMYVVIAYCSIFQPKIHYYFYFSRYYVYIIPVIVFYAASLFKNYSKGKLISLVVIPLLIEGLLSFKIAKYKDDTLMRWDAIEELCDTIEDDNSAVIIYGSYNQLCYAIPMKYMNNVDVYPEFEDMNKQQEFIQDKYENVYILVSGDFRDAFEERLTDYEEKIIKVLPFTTSQMRLELNPSSLFKVNLYLEERVIYLYYINYQ